MTMQGIGQVSGVEGLLARHVFGTGTDLNFVRSIGNRALLGALCLGAVIVAFIMLHGWTLLATGLLVAGTYPFMGLQEQARSEFTKDVWLQAKMVNHVSRVLSAIGAIVLVVAQGSAYVPTAGIALIGLGVLTCLVNFARLAQAAPSLHAVAPVSYSTSAMSARRAPSAMEDLQTMSRRAITQLVLLGAVLLLAIALASHPIGLLPFMLVVAYFLQRTQDRYEAFSEEGKAGVPSGVWTRGLNLTGGSSVALAVAFVVLLFASGTSVGPFVGYALLAIALGLTLQNIVQLHNAAAGG